MVLLLQAVEAWKQSHEGNKPKTHTEKEEFKALIKSMAKEADKELNFDEARKNAYFVHQSTNLPDEVQDIFGNAKIGDKSVGDPFWVCCSAVKKFYDANKRLPVSGTVPDMTAETGYYLEMQKVYVDKSLEDLKQCQQMLDDVCKERGLDSSNSEYQEKLQIICKNAQYLQITTLKSFKDELENFTPPEEFQWSLNDSEECNAWFIACRCFEDFRIANGRCPGQEIDKNSGAVVYPEEVSTEDITWLKNKGQEYVKKIPGVGDDVEVEEKYFYEMVRFSDTQVHTISAFLGGVASQEAIKILIKQYTIFNDTFIYDGIHGRTQVYMQE